jgi:hypothetical protein
MSRSSVSLILAAALAMPLVMAGPIADSAPGGRTLHGRSSQGLAISLGPVRRSGLRTFSYKVRLGCSDGTTFTEMRFRDDVRPRRGRFRVSLTTSRGAVQTTVKGTVTSTRATGIIRVTERFRASLNADGSSPLNRRGTVLCRSGGIRYTLR